MSHFDRLSIFEKYIQKTFVKVYICRSEIAEIAVQDGQCWYEVWVSTCAAIFLGFPHLLDADIWWKFIKIAPTRLPCIQLAGWCRTNSLGSTEKENLRWKVGPTHPHELSWQDQDEQSWWRSNFWRGDAPLKTLLLGAKKSLTENASWKSCLQSSALKLSYRSANYSPG